MQKRIKIYVISVLLFLAIPLIAMQFSNEVNWGLMDFILGGFILFSTAIICDFTFHKIENINYRFISIFLIIVLVLLIWAELAVGILENLS